MDSYGQSQAQGALGRSWGSCARYPKVFFYCRRSQLFSLYGLECVLVDREVMGPAYNIRPAVSIIDTSHDENELWNEAQQPKVDQL